MQAYILLAKTIFYDHTKPIEYPTNLTSDELASYTSLLDNSRDDLMKSLEYYSEIINLGPNIYTENGFAYHNRAYLWGIVGEWDNCISDFIVFYEHIGKENDVAQATSYYMAGVLQQIIEGPEKAIDYFYKSVTLGRVEDCEFYTDLTHDFLYRANLLHQELRTMSDDESFIIYDPKTIAPDKVESIISDYQKAIELHPHICNSSKDDSLVMNVQEQILRLQIVLDEITTISE